MGDDDWIPMDGKGDWWVAPDFDDDWIPLALDFNDDWILMHDDDSDSESGAAQAVFDGP